MKTEDREKFAREVVALGRAYGVQSIALQYRDTFRSESEMRGEHSISWAEGRHGDRENISLSYRDTKSISEEPKP